MDTSAAPALSQQLAAAFDWWREAGVDCDFTDEAHGWLSEPESAEKTRPPVPALAKKPAPPAAPSVAGSPDKWPQLLEEFAGWWTSPDGLALPGAGPLVPPRGVANPSLMVLVPMPEAADGDTLLSARQGTLVANMLAAMGIAPDAAYLASALPRHTPLADWSALGAGGLGELVRHHVALAAPERLLVLGSDLAGLLGLKARRGAQDFNCGTGTIALLASFAPDALLENARLRADLWRRWLEWTGNLR